MTAISIVPRGLKSKHQRLILILLALGAMIGAALLAMSALKDQAAFFYYPSEAIEAHIEPGRPVRIGGMVVPGSIARDADGVTIQFKISDGKADVPATYSGIVPNLFREGSGVTADGAFQANGTFKATEILAKHDERYMPREMGDMHYDEKTHQIESSQ